MTNPFEKEKHSGLIGGLLIGGVVATGLAYLFVSEDGQKVLESIKHKVKDMAKELAAGVISDKTGLEKSTVKKAEDVVAE